MLQNSSYQLRFIWFLSYNEFERRYQTHFYLSIFYLEVFSQLLSHSTLILFKTNQVFY
jgi:hypothetical protein